MKDAIRSKFHQIHLRMLQEVQDNGMVSYKVRAELENALIPEEVLLSNDEIMRSSSCLNILNKKLFKFCALKTSYICKSLFESKFFDVINSLDSTSSDISSLLLSQYHQYSRELDDIIYDFDFAKEDQSVIAAASSCLTAIARHVSLFEFDASAKLDIDAEPSDWDSAFYSSVAVAKCAEWERNEKAIDIKARTEFWNWYASVAVTDAFEFAMLYIEEQES